MTSSAPLRTLALCLTVALSLAEICGCRKMTGGDEKPQATGNAQPEESTEAKARGNNEAGKPDEATQDVPVVSAAAIRTGTALDTLPLTGTLTVFRERQAALSSPVAGTVAAIPVHTGQIVTKGQIVMQISTRMLEAQIDQARAAVRQSEIQAQQAETGALQQQAQTQSGILQARTSVSEALATLNGAKATLTGNEAAAAGARQALSRAQTLNADGLVARKDVEAADLALRSAESQAASQKQAVNAQSEALEGLRQAAKASENGHLQDSIKRKDIAIAREQFASSRAALQVLLTQREQYTVRAPIFGSVTSVGASIGESVDITSHAISIADLSRLQLQIPVPTSSLASVRMGQQLTFRVDSVPRRTFSAVIRTIGGQVDSGGSSTVIATAEASNSSGLLKDGMFARIWITLARRRNALLAPRTAVLIDTRGDSAQNTDSETAEVLKIGEDGTLHKIAVKTGVVSDDSVEILSGDLKAGDRVATTGGYGLDDGAKVRVSDSESAASDSAATPKKAP